MIYYFTGTGNSLYVARRLAELTCTKIASIAEIMKGKPMPESDKVTGIIYPIYAWSVPKMVLDFVRKHQIKADYFYSVCTCSDDTGHAMRHLEKAANNKLSAAWSILMPSNCIIAGMNLDSEDLTQRKLTDAEDKIKNIADAINSKKRDAYDVYEGSFAGLKSGIAPLLFNVFYPSTFMFYAEGSCNKCGKCAKVCPTQNITVDEKVHWGKDCTACLACINHCPVKAAQRGSGTKKKGRYINPNCWVEYDFVNSF